MEEKTERRFTFNNKKNYDTIIKCWGIYERQNVKPGDTDLSLRVYVDYTTWKEILGTFRDEFGKDYRKVVRIEELE